jgi:AbrB family looped-hinge helix DNA binding protein
MNICTLSSKGQITIPADIRRKFGLSGGHKFFLFENDDSIVIENNVHPNVLAMKEFQEAMAGEAERVGWKSEEDVVEYCKEIRREMWEERRHLYEYNG